MKKFAFAAICTLTMVGFVTAEEFFGTITKVDGNKVTFLKGNKFKGEEQKEGRAEVAATVKVHMGMIDKGAGDFTIKAGDAIEGGLKNEMFTKIGEKGVNAQITTDDKGKITQILALKGFGKGKKGGQ